MKVIIFSLLLLVSILGLDFFIKSGIFWTLDYVPYPIYFLKSFFSQSIFWHFSDTINILFGYKLFSKIWIIGTLFIGVFLGYKISKLLKYIFEIKDRRLENLLVFLSISFILLNPFIYERLMTQIWIALAVYFIGIGLIFLLFYLFKNKNRDLYFSSLFFGLAFMTMPHTAVFVVIIFILTLAFFFKKFSLKNILISIGIFFILNLNWIIGAFIFNENKTVDNISTFNEKNLEVFPVEAIKPLNNELTNSMLYGFWGERYHHLLLPNGKWYIAGFFVLIIVFIGIYYLYKKDKKLTLYLVSLGVVAYILSFGLSSDLFDGINMFLYKHIPYYVGMREAQKLTGLLMIIYSVFFLVGVYYLYKKLNDFNDLLFNRYSFFTIIFLILIAWSPNVLFGFNGQLKISDYPPEIFKSKKFLDKKNIKDDIILFPWHTYVACKWTDGKVIFNRIPQILFNVNFIKSQSIEIADLYTNNPSKYDNIVKKFLKTKDINLLKDAGIKYIYVQKYCVDYYPNYIFLEKNPNLIRIFKRDYIDIYKIR